MPIREIVEAAARLIELMGAAIIVIGLLHATISYLLHLRQRAISAYDRYKVYIGKALLLGLEFLVAADVIDTVLLEPTLENVATLGLLVLIRTFLSWSVVVEIEGRWPWRPAAAERES
jgi:uncharacterized membrane protein